MGLLIAFVIILIIGFIKNHDFSGFMDNVWLALGVIFFYWLGSLFATVSDVLSVHWSLWTVIGGIFYFIAGSLVYMKIRTLF